MTITTETYVEWLKVAFNADGTVSRAWTETITVVKDGDNVLARQQGAAAHVDEAAISAQVPEAALLAQIVTLTADRDTKAAELATATEALTAMEAELSEAQAQIAALQEQLAQGSSSGDGLSVTAVQARRALKTIEVEGGGTLLSAVRAYMATLDEDDDQRIFFEHAVTWERNSAVLIELAGHFGIEGDEVDALFALAKTLS